MAQLERIFYSLYSLHTYRISKLSVCRRRKRNNQQYPISLEAVAVDCLVLQFKINEYENTFVSHVPTPISSFTFDFVCNSLTQMTNIFFFHVQMFTLNFSATSFIQKNNFGSITRTEYIDTHLTSTWRSNVNEGQFIFD